MEVEDNVPKYLFQTKSIAAHVAYAREVQQGNPPPKQLEQVDGFVSPYNHMFWLLAHATFPFNFAKQGVAQDKIKDFKSLAVAHPLCLADGDQDLVQYSCESCCDVAYYMF